MKTIEERIQEILAEHHECRWMDSSELENCLRRIATEQKKIDKELIEMLIDKLLTSRMYHLGITGLDSAEERHRKEIENNCALVRGIDTTIRYVREAMEE